MEQNKRIDSILMNPLIFFLTFLSLPLLPDAEKLKPDSRGEMEQNKEAIMKKPSLARH